ncbi:MAG: EF-P lysine aminoacylase EpmA [Pseudomonadota bacterium]
MSWQPTASLAALKARAKLIDDIRAFFKARNILEVETPLLSASTGTDPHINAIQTKSGHYLQTSPEFAMKRLLASGSGPIFQICKAFRDEEIGQYHRQEFTMLEWYRPGFDHYQLMDETDALLQTVFDIHTAARRVSYQALFEHHLDINPHQVDIKTLRELAMQHHIFTDQLNSKDDYLDLLFYHCLQPTLQQATFVYHYPTSQAALAKIHGNIAERFELFLSGIELANGFHELCDPVEQQQRFNNDVAKRQQLGKAAVTIDQRFLAALEHSLPHCAGIALGIDRLLMITLNCDRIDATISFANEIEDS